MKKVFDFQGYFINLKAAHERRHQFENQLKNLGVEHLYIRQEASDGKGVGAGGKKQILGLGHLGCYSSHCSILEKSLESKKAIHIVEDDCVLSPFLFEVDLKGILKDYDIVFTDMGLLRDLASLQHCHHLFTTSVVQDSLGQVQSISELSLLDLKDAYDYSTSSYFVNAKSIKKVWRMLKKELSGVPKLPIDHFYRKKFREGSIKGVCVFPFLTSLNLEASMKSGISPDQNETLIFLALDTLRYSFFVGRDLKLGHQLADKYFPAESFSDHEKLMAKLFTYLLKT